MSLSHGSNVHRIAFSLTGNFLASIEISSHTRLGHGNWVAERWPPCRHLVLPSAQREHGERHALRGVKTRSLLVAYAVPTEKFIVWKFQQVEGKLSSAVEAPVRQPRSYRFELDFEH